MTDALVYWRPELVGDDAPNTGSLVGDLDALVDRVQRNDNGLISNDVVLRVALEAAHDPELATALDDLMLFRGRRMMSTVLARAADRGEMSATHDWSLLADVISAMGLLRVIGGQTADADFVRQVIDTLILPAVRTPPSKIRTAKKRS